MLPCRCLAAACFLSASILASPALADAIAEAEALFNRGLADMEAARYETGCPALGESYRLDPRPGTLFTLAECEAKHGRIATAIARYDEYLALFARLPPDKQAKQGDREAIVKSQKAALEPEVPKLTLVLPPGAPAGTVVKRDGAVLAASAIGMTSSVDPGEHSVTTQAPGGAETELRFTLGKGEKKQLTLEVKAPVDGADPAGELEGTGASSPDSGPSAQRLGAYVAGGAGLAGIVVGAILGGLTLGKKSVITDNCVDAACNAEGKAAADSAKSLGLGSTIGFALGAAGIGVGTVLFIFDPSPPAQPGSAAASKAARAPSRPQATTARSAPASRGRWVSAGVLDVGERGAMIGARGAW